MPSDDEIAIRAAVSQWLDVLNAMLNGDAEPLAGLYSHNDDVTYMGAEGTYRVGWSATFADWKAQAKKDIGGSAEGRDIHVVVSGDLATASHLTVSSIANAQGERTEVTVRETSVFRKEDGAWRMIAHHADAIQDLVEAFGN